MCTSFVYRNEKVFIGMNFDNDGKDFQISTSQGNDFLVSIHRNNKSYPSFGINKEGVFVNDLMVDPTEAGKYKRQNDTRWVTTTLIKHLMEAKISFEDLPNVLQDVEIVNSPHTSTHNLIVDRRGNTCVVEPGRKNIFTKTNDSPYYAISNFPLSDHEEIVPTNVTGSGSDRYLKVLGLLAKTGSRMTAEQGFEILNSVKQDGRVWTTELSLVYDGTNRELFYCLDHNFDQIVKYDPCAPTIFHKSHTKEMSSL